MIQFIAEPRSLSYSNNPVIYRLRTANAIGGLPFRATGAKTTITTDQTEFVAGAVLTLNWREKDGTSNAITLTAMVNPQNENEFPADQPLNIVAEYLEKHRLIAPHLAITFIENGVNRSITAEAKRIEPNWEMTFEFDFGGGAHQTTVENFLYQGTNAPQGYRVSYEVFFEKDYKSDVWKSAFEGYILPRDNGDDIYLNISDILNKECQAALLENPFARYSRTLPTIADNLRRYYVKFKESATGLSPVWTAKPVQTVLVGGLPTNVWYSYEGITPDRMSRAFLTYQPRIRRISRAGIEWLSWMNYTQETRTIKLIGDITGFNSNFNGAFQGGYEQSTTINVAPNQTVCFPVQPPAMGSSFVFARSYTVQVVEAATNNQLSQARTYIIDEDTPPQTRFLGYLNAFGVPEVAMCTGDFTRKVAIADTRAQGVRGSEAAGQITRTERHVTDYSIQYVYRSGFVNSLQKEAYTELRLSPVLFDLTTTNYLALVLKAEQSTQADTVGDTAEKLYSSEWTTEPRVALRNFGLDAFLRDAATLVEPVFLVTGGTGTTNPRDTTGGGTNGTGGPIGTTTGTTATQFTWEPLGNIQDTDILLFAKHNAAGALVGFREISNREYARWMRGIPLSAESHLDGLGVRDENQQLQYLRHTEGAILSNDTF